MGLLVEGKWQDKWYDTKANGGKFIRTEAKFRNTINQESMYKPESNRYHLYVSLACPWAHRTLIYRSLKNLEKHISVSIVNPYMLENGWTFESYPGSTKDDLFDFKYLYEVYLKADSNYSGRVTVPVLWDKSNNTIVSNESAEIIRMFNTEFNELTNNTKDFYPLDKRNEIDNINKYIYTAINNGVYKTGIATDQKIYEEEIKKLFEGLDYVESLLDKNKFLLGNEILECDLRLIPTLLRFDPVYVGHFKCNLKRIRDYPKMREYLKNFKKIDGMMELTNMDHIKTHYYGSHKEINPSGIIALGPINF
ncbi:glutathione S-transferase family protein [Alphaproteobacteria bacterium]|nr:glutathione S-transferase family protein [Alphaproteobacteria bacterium]